MYYKYQGSIFLFLFSNHGDTKANNQYNTSKQYIKMPNISTTNITRDIKKSTIMAIQGEKKLTVSKS